MATFNLYTLDKEEIIRLLTKTPRYSGLYAHMTLYCDNNPLTAQLFVVKECEKLFQYDEYVKSASDALDKVEKKWMNGMYKLSPEAEARRLIAQIPLESAPDAEKRISEKNAHFPHTSLKTSSGTFEFVVKTENGTQYCELIKATNVAQKVKIPDCDSAGHPVVRIGERAFFKQNIEEVTFTYNIKHIDDCAFTACAGLSNICAHAKVETIGYAAFAGCALSAVSFESITSVGDYAFACCGELKYVYLGKYLKSVGSKAFAQGCTKDILLARPQSEWPAISFGKDWYSGTPKYSSNGCYVATCVYGSYDCPEVWTLRRFRDYKLGSTWYGRAFIHTYYTISPTLVKWFGETNWFKKMWRGTLDRMVRNLQDRGVADTPYEDKHW